MSGAWELRPAGPEDLEAVVEIFRAEDLHVRGRSEMALDAFGERIARDPEFDALRDQVVAEAEGTLLGAAILTSRAANIAVHPDRDAPLLRRGLLLWSEHRQADKGRQPYHVAVPAANTATTELLRRAGYHAVRFYSEMSRGFSGGGRPEPVTTPRGYRIRPIEPDRDGTALWALDDRAFRDRPDYQPETLAQYEQGHLCGDGYAPGWSLLMETTTGRLVGSLLGSRRPHRSTGYVAVLAVEPDHRRRGLARALLLESFARMYDAGMTGAELHVASDNDRALDLYRGAGMVEGERFEHYERMP